MPTTRESVKIIGVSPMMVPSTSRPANSCPQSFFGGLYDTLVAWKGELHLDGQEGKIYDPRVGRLDFTDGVMAPRVEAGKRP